jgi:hypothetical protein
MSAFLKSLIITLLTLSQLSAAPGSQGAKLIDLLVTESGVLEILGQRGMRGEVAKTVQSYVQNSFKAFNPAMDDINKTQLRQIISDLDVSGDDLRIKNELEQLLEKSTENLSKDDVVTAINNLIFLANRHGLGGTAFIGCSDCVSGALSLHGYKFTFAVVKNQRIADVVSTVLPRKPRDVSNFIDQRMKKMELGSFRNIPKEIVAPEEERSLAVFLTLAESGDQVHRDLIDAITQVSKRPDGKVNLLDKRNPHQLWKLFTPDENGETLSVAEMQNWTRILKEVAEEGKSDISKKEAFYTVLEREASNDPVSLEYINLMRSKGCYFK